MSLMRCRRPSADVGGAPGIPTAGAMVPGSAASRGPSQSMDETMAAIAPLAIRATSTPTRARTDVPDFSDVLAMAYHRLCVHPVEQGTVARCEGSRSVVAVVVSLMRRRDVRERRPERRLILIDAVAEQVVRRPVRVSVTEPESLDDRSDDRPVAAGERPQLDVGHVVLEPPAVREAGKVAPQ